MLAAAGLHCVQPAVEYLKDKFIQKWKFSHHLLNPHAGEKLGEVS